MLFIIILMGFGISLEDAPLGVSVRIITDRMNRCRVNSGQHLAWADWGKNRERKFWGGKGLAGMSKLGRS